MNKNKKKKVRKSKNHKLIVFMTCYNKIKIWIQQERHNNNSLIYPKNNNQQIINQCLIDMIILIQVLTGLKFKNNKRKKKGTKMKKKIHLRNYSAQHPSLMHQLHPNTSLAGTVWTLWIHWTFLVSIQKMKPMWNVK